jgi:hypothetical protein
MWMPILSAHQGEIAKKKIHSMSKIRRFLYFLFTLITFLSSINDIILINYLYNSSDDWTKLAFKFVVIGFIADYLNAIYFFTRAMRIFKSKQIAPSLAFARTFNLYLGISDKYSILLELIKNNLTKRGKIALFLCSHLSEIIGSFLIAPFNSSVMIYISRFKGDVVMTYVIMFNYRMAWLIIQFSFSFICLLAAIGFQIWLWKFDEGIQGSWKDKLIRRVMIREMDSAIRRMQDDQKDSFSEKPLKSRVLVKSSLS